MIDDASKAVWQRHFTPFLHPHLPVLATLMETADKLNAARGFIEPLSHGDVSEREAGLFVGNLAIRYGMTMLDHLGFGDGDEYPLPIHLDQAKNALKNLVDSINENIQLGQIAVGGTDEEAEDSNVATEDEDTGDASRRPASAVAGTAKRPKRSETPDKYEADLRVKRFTDNHPNATVKEVVAETGISAGRISKLESWRRLMAQRKADRLPLKKSERQLTDKMLAVRGTDDDPVEKVMEDEAIWLWLLDITPVKKKADLWLLDDVGKANLIEASRKRYREGEPGDTHFQQDSDLRFLYPLIQFASYYFLPHRIGGDRGQACPNGSVCSG